MIQTECPNLNGCPFFNRLALRSSEKVLKNLFCLSRYQNCARYKITQSGGQVPADLWPNGKTV
ncbi:MAG: hypothetical protein GF403_07005 [Candidatus Coatesbacteria bacterium]|nr:hypothetical protein [Candidatus Coatesbacteria bacterium]